MEAHRTRITVANDRSATLHDLPFEAGEELDVILLERTPGDGGNVKEVAASERQKGGTAGDLARSASPDEKKQTVLESGLAGLWKDRDLPDSPTYARQLREQAQNRPHLKKFGLGRDSS